MMRLFFLPVILVLGYLFITNPTLEDCFNYAEKRVAEKQSRVRAGWSSVSKTIGLDWVGRNTGLGKYEFCRKDLYVMSLFQVRSNKALSTDEPLALALGIGGQILSFRTDNDKGNSAIAHLTDVLDEVLKSVPFAECGDFHKSGELTAM